MNNDEPGRRRRRRSELLCRKSHKTFLLNSLFGGDTLQDDAAFKTKLCFLSSFSPAGESLGVRDDHTAHL